MRNVGVNAGVTRQRSPENPVHRVKILPLVAFVIAVAMLSPQPEAIAFTIAPGIPVENPPTAVAKKKPSTDDYNALLRQFLGTELVDLSRENINPKLADLFRNDSSNAVYARLKVRERDYNGAILVSPVAIDKEQIIVVAARIVYMARGKKTMHTEYFHIVFDRRGKFIEIRKGPNSDQVLG